MDEKKNYTIALAGNPNTGKTSIFNILAKQHQHVGNWPGVTVEKKEGIIFENGEMKVNLVDLPGIYSLRTTSEDEIVASDFLIRNNPDMTVVVLDASRLERSLYLYMQIKELGQKTVAVLNMNDIAESNGIHIDVDKLTGLLNCPVIKTVASNNTNLKELRDIIIETLKNGQKIVATKFRESVANSIEEIEKIIPDLDFKVSKYNLAIRIAEKDKYFSKEFLCNDEICLMLKKENDRTKDLDNSDLQTEIIEDRWNFINSICSQVISRINLTKTSEIISNKIDKIVVHKYFGLPIFFGVIFMMFFFVYNIGNSIVGLLENLIEKISLYSSNILMASNTPEIIKSLIVDGVIGGVGAVVVFFPNIFLLFLFLGLLEDSGYLSRGTFVMDRLMHAIGLHGKSFIPLIMGFGCSVPAIIGTRILERRKDKLLTMLVVPFISCSARLPVFILFAGAFFKEKAALVIFSLYMFGIIIAIIIAKVLSLTLFKGESSLLVMELPAYHMPRIKNILSSGWEKSYEFLKRATTFIMITVLGIWALGNLPAGVEYASRESYIGIIGSKIDFIFSAAGYGFWQAAVALISGFLAKEAIIGTLGALFANDSGNLSEAIVQYFTPLSAYSYLIMILLYTPCLSAITAFKQESNSWKWTAFLIAYTFGVAIVVSTLVYQIFVRV